MSWQQEAGITPISQRLASYELGVELDVRIIGAQPPRLFEKKIFLALGRTERVRRTTDDGSKGTKGYQQLEPRVWGRCVYLQVQSS